MYATSSTAEQPLNSVLEPSDQLPIEALEKAPKVGSFAGVAGACFVLLNSMLGSGMLALPFAFAASGFVGGSVLLVVFGLLAIFGLHLLLASADRLGRPASFYSICTAAGGAKLALLVDFCIFSGGISIATAYLVVIGDILPEIAGAMGAGGVLLWRSFWVLLMLVFAAPLACLRDISALRFSAYVAFVSVLFIVMVVVVNALAPATFQPCEGADSLDSCRGSLTLFPADALKAISAIPIFMGALTCHQNGISVTNEMTPRGAMLGGSCAVGVAVALYVMISVAGYLTFGSKVQSDVLNNYPEDSVPTTVARVLLAFVVTMCYPMQIHPARTSLLSILSFCGKRCGWPALADGARGSTLHVLSTALLVGATAGIGLKVTSLGLMLAIAGAIVATTVQYIMPGFCYYVLFPEVGLKRWLGLVQMVVGVVLMILSLVLTAMGE